MKSETKIDIDKCIDVSTGKGDTITKFTTLHLEQTNDKMVVLKTV